MKDAAYWIEKLEMEKHPEGGWFRETYRSDEHIAADNLPGRYTSDHCFSTTIYFLLKEEEQSVFHRLKSDETWHFYTGTSVLRISIISREGELSHFLLGPNPDYDEVFQVLAPKNHWFAAELTNSEGYALIGCTVAPGFEYADFEMASRENLIQQFPQHERLIQKLAKR